MLDVWSRHGFRKPVFIVMKEESKTVVDYSSVVVDNLLPIFSRNFLFGDRS